MNSTTFDTQTRSVEETERLGHILGEHLFPGAVIALIGDLGAGKTALTRGLAQGWGTSYRVTSPTFTLVNEYPRRSDGKILFHLDCYRLGSSDEAETIGLGDILAEEGAVVIEWADVVADWLPADHLTITIRAEPDPAFDQYRQVTITAGGENAQQLLNTLIEQLKQP